MKKIIIGLIGELGAGKGTAAAYLKEKYGASVYRFSTMLRDVLERLYLGNSRANMQNLSTILREEFGEDLMAKVIAEDVKNDSNKIIAVDGVRRFADIVYLKKIDGFVLAKIIAEPKTRYERLIKRKENAGESAKTFEEFLADHKKEADAEIPGVMKRADVTIDNNGSLEKFYKQIDSIIENN